MLGRIIRFRLAGQVQPLPVLSLSLSPVQSHHPEPDTFTPRIGGLRMYPNHEDRYKAPLPRNLYTISRLRYPIN